MIASTGAERPAVGLTWVGRVLEGAAGVSFTDGPGELTGYEHST